MTDTRFGGSGIVSSTNVTDSKNTTDDTKLGGDGSKIKGSEESEVNKGSGESKDINKDEDEEEGLSNSSRKKKEGFRGEDCDPSNMCTDEEDQFVACLRVPGNGESLLCLRGFCLFVCLVHRFELCFINVVQMRLISHS